MTFTNCNSGHSADYWKSPQSDSDVRDNMYQDKLKRDELNAIKAELAETKEMVEQLIEAGEFLAESYREQVNLDDEHPIAWRWDALVAKWKNNKKE